ncbi:DUF1989 domain-containing protein [Nocardioides sp. cx-173]|uniref:DUF1989 domain-containing protein n=1 Tax=Nocardioides sp. cx-173 TaxID=2898796 RepID=UPI001E56A69B|nr:DUF1989 domain-containing protein [Nocardioides sp. cx-173]MCD4524040.1 DUF1989 domain-containing protein [Nocardioides sp. cx-173]UGB41441.1 DUF1989 domain-containing protein [Nocardioides sp. cx-173]
MTGRTVEVPRGHATRFDLAVGDRLTVTTPDARSGGDLTFPWFDRGITRNVIGYERYGAPPKLPFHVRPGETLHDTEGTAVLLLEENTSLGEIDIMLPGCRRATYADGRAGCRELVAAALGIPVREVTGMASFWENTTATADYYDPFGPKNERPGDSFSVLALRPVSVAVSSCPDTRIRTVPGGCLVVTT